MAERAWMPIFWGDYVRDTLHLTTEQHGAYLLLICSYWVTGRPLPDDDKQLSQVCRMSVKKWKTSCQIVKGFFRQANGHLVHDRIEKELLRCSERSAKARASAQQRARALPDPESDKTQSLVLPSELPFVNPESDGEGGVGGESTPGRTMPSPQAAPARSSPNRKANGHHQPERATRLSPDWRPGDDGIAYAMGELGNDTALVNETWTSFRDFWLAKAGPGARKVSWPLTWKTWVRRTRDDLRERHARLERLQPKAARH